MDRTHTARARIDGTAEPIPAPGSGTATDSQLLDRC